MIERPFLPVNQPAINAHPPFASVIDAERIEREAFAAIGALGRREIDAVKAWIAGGCEGEQPKPDMAERARLSLGLSAAIKAREAAEKAARGPEGQASHVHAHERAF